MDRNKLRAPPPPLPAHTRGSVAAAAAAADSPTDPSARQQGELHSRRFFSLSLLLFQLNSHLPLSGSSASVQPPSGAPSLGGGRRGCSAGVTREVDFRRTAGLLSDRVRGSHRGRLHGKVPG